MGMLLLSLPIQMQKSKNSSKTTNEGRRQVYADLAQRNGITVDAVDYAAEKLREKAARGEYVQNTSGQWEKK